MPATVTLSSTTLAAPVLAGDRQVRLTTTTGVLPGLRLYMDGESMSVVGLGIDSWVNVLRGTDGTLALRHDSGATVYLGRADQFYSSDPTGRPAEAIPVSPYINVRNGSVWFARGGTDPANVRWWQKQTVTFEAGALGVNVTTYDPTEST